MRHPASDNIPFAAAACPFREFICGFKIAGLRVPPLGEATAIHDRMGTKSYLQGHVGNRVDHVETKLDNTKAGVSSLAIQ